MQVAHKTFDSFFHAEGWNEQVARAVNRGIGSGGGEDGSSVGLGGTKSLAGGLMPGSLLPGGSTRASLLARRAAALQTVQLASPMAR